MGINFNLNHRNATTKDHLSDRDFFVNNKIKGWVILTPYSDAYYYKIPFHEILWVLRKFVGVATFFKSLFSFYLCFIFLFLERYIDDGKNPLLYTKDCLMKTLKKNEEIRGKIVTFNSFRELLLEEFNKNFPEDFCDYAKIRNSSGTDLIDQQIKCSESTAIDATIVKKEN